MENNSKNKKLTIIDICFAMLLFSLCAYIWTSNILIGLVSLLLFLPLIIHPGYHFAIMIALSITEFCTGIIFGRALIDWMFLLSLAVTGIHYLSGNGKKTKASILQGKILLLIIFVALNAVITGTHGASTFRRFIILLLIIFFSLNSEVPYNEAKRAFKWTSYSLAILFAFYFFLKIGINISLTRYSIELEANINSAAFSVMTVMAILVAQILWGESLLEKILPIILLIPQSVVLISIASRSALLALVFTSGVLIFLQFGKKNNRKAIFVAACIIVALYFVLNNLNWNAATLDRLSLSSILEDKGSSRFVYWEEILRVVVSRHWLEGIGIESNALLRQLEKYGLRVHTGYTHNMILQYIVSFGIPATMFVLNVQLKMFFNHLPERKTIIYYQMVAIIVSTLLYGFGESCGFYSSLWIALLVVGLSVRDDVVEESNL